MRPSLTLVLVLLAAEPAHAWVCSRVVDSSSRESGPSLSWSHRDLTFAFLAGGTNQLPLEDTFAALRASFAAWVDVQQCAAPAASSDITFTEETGVVTRDLIGFDFLHPDENHNTLIFRDAEWGHPGQQGSRIIALTTTTYSAQTGEILDADIEFNSASFQFSVGDVDVKTDLMNTAVHEIGHILGLGHPDVWAAIDPDCASASTMCSTAQPGDIDKRTLACDDRDALVFKYPAGRPNGYCSPPTCAVDNEGCGNCTSATCIDWADCGFCAPPTPLLAAATITAAGFNDGMGGCFCAGASSHGAAVALGLAGLLAAARRRRR